MFGLVATYFVLYSTLSILRHRTYHSFGPDLGLFDQIFWNSTQGRWWESTMSQGLAQPHSYFGDHFSPIYWLLLPFYYVFAHPETLLTIQTLFLSLGAVPIYLLAREKLPAGFLRLVWVVAYFLFLPVAYVNLYDFHETALSVVPLGFAIYFLERGKVRWFLISLLFAFLIKEEMALIGIGFGAYVLLGKHKLALGLGVLAASLATFVALVSVVIPAFSIQHSYPYFASRYGDLGNTPGEIVRTAFSHPLTVARTLLQAKKLSFLIGIFGPVLGLTAVSGFAAILVLPTLGYLLLSNYAPQFSFTNQYAAPLIPLVLGTSVLGLAALPASARRAVAAAVLLSSLSFSFLYGDLPWSRRFDPGMFRAEPRYTTFVSELQRIPSTARVSSQNNLTPHLSHRRYIYAMEYQGIQDADYVALDYAASLRNPDRLRDEIEALTSRGYEVVAGAEGLALLRRREPIAP